MITIPKNGFDFVYLENGDGDFDAIDPFPEFDLYNSSLWRDARDDYNGLAGAIQDFGVVYCIGRRGSRVKIGHTKNLKRRLSQLQTGSPFQLFIEAFVPATTKTEAALHQRFSERRLAGEWFCDDGCEVSDYVEYLCGKCISEGMRYE